MRRFTMMVLLAALAVSLAGAASANTWTPRVDRREAHQRARIAQGVRSGQLTPREARHLRAGERRIHRMERRAKADGVVTPRELRRLNVALNHESRAIYRLKHNARVR